MEHISKTRRGLIAIKIKNGDDLDSNDMACILSLLMDEPLNLESGVMPYKAIRGRGRRPGMNSPKYIFMAQEFERIKDELGSANAAYAELKRKFPTIGSIARIKSSVTQGRSIIASHLRAYEEFMERNPDHNWIDIAELEVSKK
jgi:hypothetical protein